MLAQNKTSLHNARHTLSYRDKCSSDPIFYITQTNQFNNELFNHERWVLK